VVLPLAGRVGGTVLGASGSPVVGASVTVLRTADSFNTTLQPTVTTGQDGTFDIGQVAPGQNFLKVRLPDGTSFSQVVTVTSGQTTTLVVPLAPAR
jgi:hypothetical protein